MTNGLKFNIIYYSSIFSAVCFVLTSWIWTYYANLFLSVPFGMLSLLFWFIGKKGDSRKDRYKVTLYILIAGIISSLAILLFFLFFN